MARKNKEPKNTEWIELCEYVKKEILQYDDNMKFPTYFALRLQGLKKGQYIANKFQETHACYDDHTLLCAFKISKNRIVDYLKKNETKITGENHKINLILKMVEPEINDVYLRLQQAKRQEKRIESESFDNQYGNGADYAVKTRSVSDKMKKLF